MEDSKIDSQLIQIIALCIQAVSALVVAILAIKTFQQGRVIKKLEHNTNSMHEALMKGARKEGAEQESKRAASEEGEE